LPQNRRLKTGLQWVWLPVLVIATISCSFIADRFSASQRRSSASSGVIAYVGTDGNIYSIDQNGSQPTAITQDASGGIQNYQFPAWSPDSQRVSYLGIQDGSSSSSSANVYTAAPDGKDKVRVFQSQEESPFYFFWSPDGRYLSFLAADAATNGLDLQLVPARGGEPKSLGKGSPFYWDWSPDSQTIIVHVGGDASTNPDARLAFLNLATQAEKKLDLRPGVFQAPAWSPNGKQLILSIAVANRPDALMLLKADGSVEKTFDTSSGPQAFGWSPDGKRIAYLVPKGADSQGLFRTLKLFDLASQQSKLIVQEDEVMAFFWSPDGQKIAYFIPLLAPQPTGPQGISQTQPSFQLSLLVYDVGSEASHQVVSFTSTNEFLTLIPFFDQYQHSAALWSPDSQHLVVSAIDPNGKAGIYVVNASGTGSMENIAAGSLAFWSWK
jgi:TolB protein